MNAAAHTLEDLTMARDRRPFRDDRRPSRYQSMYGEARGTQYRVLCSDGRVRIATATAGPDTMDTVPARVSVNGRTVSGHVYHRGNIDYRTPGWPAYADDDPTPLYRFSAYAYRRNGASLPAWPDHAPYNGDAS